MVPIFDSKSREKSETLVASPGFLWSPPCNVETEYGRHCHRILSLYNMLQQERKERAELKIVDYVLYFALGNRTTDSGL
jgi:hypothetical protein